jgi:hypothetical protein
MANTKPKTRTATLNLRLHPGERRALELIGQREGLGSLSDAARQLLRESIQRRGIQTIGLSQLLADSGYPSDEH